MKKRTNNHLLLTTVFLLVFMLIGIPVIQSQENSNILADFSEHECIDSKSFDTLEECGDLLPGQSLYSSDGTFQDHKSIDVGIPVKKFKAALVDDDNTIWFLTEAGILSFNDGKWKIHDKNPKIASPDFNGFDLEAISNGQQMWIASPNGVVVAKFPIDDQTSVTTYQNENSPVQSNNVKKVAVAHGTIRWIGTDKGISALKMNKWLTPSYDDEYPEFIFNEYPILSMATDTDGDTLYIGTDGVGVARVFSDDVDGISAASVYAQWGPILLPSDKICCIFIASDDEKWFGTDKGAARHIGRNTDENWTAFTTEEGLVNNFVQTITADKEGRIWFGTQGGISVFDGSSWISYTENDGLVSNNVLCIVVGNTGVVWIGTDNGVSSFDEGKFTNYQ